MIEFVIGDRIRDSNFATSPTVRSDLLYDQIHVTLCMYMRRSTLVLFYIYIYVYIGIDLLRHIVVYICR